MEVETFEQGMKLAFRIKDLQEDVAAFLKDNHSSIAALPILTAESELHKTVAKVVHTEFKEMMKADPKVRERVEKYLPKEKIDQILSEGEAPTEEVVDFDPIK